MPTQYSEHLAYIDDTFNIISIQSITRDKVLEWMTTLSKGQLDTLNTLLVMDDDDREYSGPTRDFIEEHGGERQWWYNIYTRANATRAR